MSKEENAAILKTASEIGKRILSEAGLAQAKKASASFHFTGDQEKDVENCLSVKIASILDN